MAKGLCAAALLAALAALCAPALAADINDVISVFQNAQQEVLSSWRYDPNLVCASSAICGPAQKRASGSALSNLFTLPTSTDPSHPAIAAGMPLFSGIQVYISDKYKFIYIRQPKASSSSIITNIQQMYCEGPTCTEYEFKRMHVVFIDDAVWASYFVFTAIRNPLSRMLSTYRMFEEHLRYREPGTLSPGPSCNIGFLDYSQRVALLRTICETDNCCAYVAGNMNEFVDKLVNAHITQQAHAIFTPAGESVVDYIACTENIDVGWEAITQAIARTSGLSVPFQPLLHANSAKARAIAAQRTSRFRLQQYLTPLDSAAGPSCVAPEAFHLLNETTIYGLAKQFAVDLRVLQYMQVPQVSR